MAAAGWLGLPGLLGVVVAGAISVLLVLALVRRYVAATVPDEPEPEPEPEPESEPEPDAAEAPAGEAELVRRAKELEKAYGNYADSRQVLLEDSRFVAAVEALSREEPSIEELLRLARDNRGWVSRIALGVLATRNDVPKSWGPAVYRRLEDAAWDHAGLFLASLTNAPGKVIGHALSNVQHVLDIDLVHLIDARVTSGRETVDAELLGRQVSRSHRDDLESLLEDYEQELPGSVVEALREWLRGQIDLGPELNGRVEVWAYPFLTGSVHFEQRRHDLAVELGATVTAAEAASVIVIGEHGVGKSTLIRKALEGAGPTWLAFEAGASSVNAGAMYVGQLDGRVEELVSRLQDGRIVWVFPAFQEALWAGAYSGDPRGLLDALLPHVERGTIRLVAEVTPEGYELLVNRRPRVASAFKALRLHPLDGRATLAVCRSVVDQDLALEVSDDVLRQSFEFAEQFLPGISPPGNTIRLLKATAVRAREQEAEEITATDVLGTLSVLTGIPTEILDPTRPLGLARVRGFLEDRVLGQAEAVDVVVERIALVKAGLTDPTRPLGVFLFVGPTGTGKTELAKALAELVFGSAARLVRLDMSEYQTPDGLERLLGDANVDDSASPLIASVRRDPFSVVLLDEFEKAALPVRDLFLQLFDDGRLTDRTGRTTDFRHCIVIMTSNAGSAFRSGPGVGFEGGAEEFRSARVERELARAFRPEFLNRIDRIVVFQPFERSQMRALLEKEIEDVRHRKGLRDRPWAIEIDESATEFLIEHGFSPELGARPLKRAVEQHVLTPLARAIADAQVPTGDQFLFLSAEGGRRIEVAFVGLEPEESAPTPGDVSDPADGDGPVALRDDGLLRRLVLRGVRRAEEREALTAVLARTRQRVDGVAVERKEWLLAELGRDGFWERDDRFAILAEIEYLDRLQAATETARRLGERLAASRTEHALADVSEILAVRLHVLDQALDGLEAEAPFEVFLRLRLPSDVDDQARGRAFLDQIAGMYGGWATRRGMKIRPLRDAADERVLLVSGLGCGAILRPEAGLHVQEHVEEARDGGQDVERLAVSVAVAAAPPGPERGAEALLVEALEALDDTSYPARVVRRYRLEPQPLVRDAVRGYRTGRAEAVLAGDFDLFEEA